MDFDRMLRYCAELELNNNREWFHANHDFYERAKEDFTELVDLLKYRVANAVTPDMAEKMLFTQPRDMMFRIPRDARVWKNKPPSNPSWRAFISPDRKGILPLGYFIMIAPGGQSHFCTGAWFLSREQMYLVRNHIVENFDLFEDILERGGLELMGDSLKRVPPEYDPGDPWAEYMKLKEWYVVEYFPDSSLGSFEDFEKTIDRCLARMEPLRRFLDDALTRRVRSPWNRDDLE